jgi:hypothetical protein
MALRDEGPKVTRVGGSSGTRVPMVLVVLALSLFVVALVKPWTFGPRGRSGTVSAPPLSPTPTAKASDPGSYVAQPGRLYPQCYATAGWRVAALQRNGDLEVRTVWPVALAESATPQTALSTARLVFGGGVRGIGFCAPGSDEETRIAYTARVSVWSANGAGVLTLIRDAVTIDQDLADLGEVYLAPPPTVSTDGTWPAGRYVFRVDAGGDNATWFALRIATFARSPSPSMSASPQSTDSYGRQMSR